MGNPVFRAKDEEKGKEYVKEIQKTNFAKASSSYFRHVDYQYITSKAQLVSD